jgi:MscS family membrane protein
MLKELWALCQGNGWLCQLVLVLLLSGVVYMGLRFLFAGILKRCVKTQSIWDDALIEALGLPLSLLVLLIAVVEGTGIVLSQFSDAVTFAQLSQARNLGIVVLFTLFFWRFIKQVEARMLQSHPWRPASDPTTVTVVARLMRIILVIVTVLLVLQMQGIPVTGLWAFGGGGALVVGIAAKDVLANFFGGMIIFIDRPFKVGDWIESPDRNIQGTVAHIGWRSTRLTTFDRRPLYVPNSVFTTVSVLNPQRMTNRRINATIGLRYEDGVKVASVVEGIKGMLQQHKDIDTKQSLMVHFVNFGASTLDINIYCFTKTTNWAEWREIQQDVFIKIMEIVTAQGADMAFPTTTLHVADPVKIKGQDYD